MTNGGKIFGIGFQKTGTSSLNEALAILGYRAGGGLRINHPKGVAVPPPLTSEKVLAVALKRAGEADAFTDNPWPMLYRELDSAFPGSKFILTVREPLSWLESAVRHFADQPSEVMQWIYGVPYPRGNEARCLNVYLGHNTAVRGYFANRPGEFLELDFSKGAGWKELCGFLGKQAPRAPFPHSNKAVDRARKQRSVYRRLKEKMRLVFSP